MTIDRREEEQQNLRIAEALYAAFNQEDLAVLVKLLDERIEVSAAGDSYEGHKGFGRWYQGSGGHKRQVTDVVPAGPGALVVVSAEGAELVELDDGKVVGLHLHSSKEKALAAAKKRKPRGEDG